MRHIMESEREELIYKLKAVFDVKLFNEM